MYYIYHIPGIKIGCTIDLARRMRQQKCSKWELLETHFDKEIASNREIELQKKYGYRVDRIRYAKADYASVGSIGGKLGGKLSKPNMETLRKNGLKSVMNGRLAEMRKISNEKCKKPIEVYDLNGNLVGEYESSVFAINELQLSQALVSKVLNGKRNSHKGYTFKYKTTSEC